MKWRRTYDCPPPALEADNPLQRTIRLDDRYLSSGVTAPAAESLQDVCFRVQELYEDTILPALKEGKNVLVVAHGNTLRGLVKLVDGVSEADSFFLDLPTACPIVYDFDADLNFAHPPRGFWGESSAARYGRFLYSEQKVRQAQALMRQQCQQNIAVSTVAPANAESDDEVAQCDAWTSDGAGERMVTLGRDDTTYRVRERPPSYFALESERIKAAAQQEINSMLESVQRQEEQMKGVVVPTESAASLPRAKPPKAMLIVLRHGYSEWNAQNRFTGWADVELSNRGREEARFAGQLLREAGVRRMERVYSSFLKRAIKTAWLMLDELEMQWTPISYDWRLNERHYGLLQGQPKKQCSELYGMKQVQKWRRGIHCPPPPWDTNLARATIDRRYDGVDVPESESLAQCTARLRPFLEEELKPAMRASMKKAAEEERRREREMSAAMPAPAPPPLSPPPRSSPPPGVGTRTWERTRDISLMTQKDVAGASADSDLGLYVPTYCIASSENLIRALVAELEGLDEDKVPLLDIPYATPLVYQFDEDLNLIPSSFAAEPLQHGCYLGDMDRIREVQRDIRDGIRIGPTDAEQELAQKASDVAAIETEEPPSESCYLTRRTSEGKVEDVWVCDDEPEAAGREEESE